jgi:predicted metal-dependent hydrolase
VIIDSTPKEHIPEDRNETVESEIPVDPPKEVTITKKRPAWLRNTLQEAEKHVAPSGSFRERKIPHKFSSYVALISKIIDSEPSTYEDVVKKQVWKDAMMKEYQSIMKNDVWEVVCV